MLRQLAVQSARPVFPIGQPVENEGSTVDVTGNGGYNRAGFGPGLSVQTHDRRILSNTANRCKGRAVGRPK
jgi:hypothetical protein